MMFVAVVVEVEGGDVVAAIGSEKEIKTIHYILVASNHRTSNLGVPLN